MAPNGPYPLAMDTAGPLGAENALTPAADCQPDEEISQESRVQDTGVVDRAITGSMLPHGAF